MRIPLLILGLVIACGKSKAPPTLTSEPTTGSAAGSAVAPASAPAIGADECCCPFASSEGVAYNVSPKADCEAAGTGCVDAAQCAN